MIKKISSMGIVISKGGQVLLLNSDGEWVFPKGHVEHEEDYVEAAIREIKEESSVNVTKEQCKGQVDEFSFYFGDEGALKVIKVILFIVDIAEPILFNKEECFIDGKWATIEDAIKELKHDDARQALIKAVEIYNNDK